MTDSEDRILRDNAGEVNQTAEAIQELKIYNAMVSGIHRGKERVKRRSLFSGVSITLTVAAVVLLIFTFLQAPPEETEYAVRNVAPNKVWTDSKKFDSSHLRSKSLENALEKNLIQPVYKSVEKAGFRVEVMGTVSDGRQVYILYSVHNNSGETVIHAGFSLDFGKFEAADIGAKLEMAGSDNEIRAGQTVYFVYSNYLSLEADYPKDVKYNVILTQISEQALSSSSNKYRTGIHVPFELNTGLLNDQNRTWFAKQDMTIGGQKLKVNQVLFTPLNTYVDVEVDERNSKQIFGLINPVLIGKSGDKMIKSYYPTDITTNNSEIISDESNFTLVYKSSEYAALDTLSLKTFGIAALDKNQMKIVVDLNKKEIIDAPDGLTLDDSDKTAGAGALVFRHKVETDQAKDSFIMLLKDSYTDARGKIHTKAVGSGYFSQSLSRGSSAVEEKFVYYFGEKADELPQPLTIEIDRYWNPVMDTQSLELFSK
ncbi:DUF4179 domain-containing protein [Paenibacillus ihuae]|uniref:DUF4179 domain-containing protein n=1 Tax=Paenibacillus ihuae TaxID=1232431 RepID=UPI0006D534F3|nr:DUF4179 domain-containing protein [Paenibacillus ihuae]